MEEDKRQLEGSPSRDKFKRWHKDLDRQFYAFDLDFVFVSKSPPGIIAVVDYKLPGDYVTFAEALGYNMLLSKDIPVFIVESAILDSFAIFRYLGGDWKPEPPDVELELVAADLDVDGFAKWESKLRREWTYSHWRKRKTE